MVNSTLVYYKKSKYSVSVKCGVKYTPVRLNSKSYANYMADNGLRVNRNYRIIFSVRCIYYLEKINKNLFSVYTFL